MKLLRSLTILTTMLVIATTAVADDVFMPRFPGISPDGNTVVFSFQGDLWSCAATGGQALRLTAHEAYDYHPVFSPDGKTIAFASDRYGDDDIYLMPAEGGAPRRLTYAASGDRPGAFSPDGKTLYFASRRLFKFPMGQQIQSIPVAGGTPVRLADMFGDEVATADGKTFIIAEGRVKPHRVHYRGSYQREIYSYSPGGDPVRLTFNRNYDMNPMVAPDGQVFWIGDENKTKTANIYAMDANGENQRQITKFKGDGVRSAALSANGQKMVIEQGTSLYLLDMATNKKQEISIQVAADAIENPIIIENKTGDASDMAVSSDGKEFALVIGGDIVLVNKDLGGRAKVVVPGPFRERQISFKPGTSDTLMLVTDRFGEDTICLLYSEDEEQPSLRLSRKLKLEKLTESKSPATEPLFSPDGKKILYTEGNANVRVMDFDGGNDKELFPHWSVQNYSWSPDGQWVAISRYDANFNSDILIMPAEGGKAINVTRHPDADENPVWSADGTILAWSTSRHSASPNSNNYDVYYLYLTQELHERTKEEWEIWEKTRDLPPPSAKKDDADKDDEDDADKDDDEADDEEEEKLNVVIDFDDIYLRAQRLTSGKGMEQVVAIDPKGDNFYFLEFGKKGSDLIKVNRFAEDRKELTKGGSSPRSIELSEDGKTFTFLKKGKPSWVASSGGDIESTDFSARLTINRPAMRLQVLDEGWRQLRDWFYDADMHGVDWPAMRKKYGEWVQKVGHDRDFSSVVNMMLGELNASHMGYYPNFESPGNYGTDGFLGLEFASANKGDDLVISHVLKNGPCDKVKSKLLVGDILLEIDGQKVSRTANLYRPLETTSGLPIWIRVSRDGEEMEFEVKPVGFGTIWGLNYTRMEEANRAICEKETNTRVGYVHIQGMGFRNVERFEQNLFAAADGKEALIIDVRNNGGGWTTDLLLTILTQPVHAYTIARNGEIGYPQSERQPFYRWSKPVVVICNEGSYSNAEIFSHAIKTIGRGPVVGMETGGNVISTGGFGNRYNGYIRQPFRGWYVWGDEKHPERNRKNQEGVHDLTGCIPDYIVPLTMTDRLHGRDPQLAKAMQLAIEAADAEARKPQPADKN